METILYFTMTNHGFCDMVKNLAKSMEHSNISNKLYVGCLDQQSVVDLRNVNNIECFPFFDDNIVSHATLFNTDDFNNIMLRKLDMIKYMIQQKHPCKYLLFLDSDIVFYRNPLEYINKLNDDIDFCIQNEACYPSQDTNLFCAGFMLMKNDAKVLPLFEYDPSYKGDDQSIVNSNVHKLSIKYFVFPNDLFPNGTVFYRPGNVLPNKYMQHFNCMYLHEKKPRMIMECSWFL